MDVCFTGTREGMTEDQQRQVAELLALAKPDRVCHGCAVGADRQFHELAEPGTRDLFPSNSEQAQWALDNAVHGDRVCAQLPPLVRNKQMVDQSTLIIATPRSETEELRSGTWHTVRYARREKVKRQHLVIFVLPPRRAVAVGAATEQSDSDRRERSAKDPLSSCGGVRVRENSGNLTISFWERIAPQRA